MRSLSPEEAELWARVAATIRPFSRELRSSPDQPFTALKPVDEREPADVRRVEQRTSIAAPALHGAQELKHRTLDGTWDKRLRSGSVQPDRVVDLHGMNLDSAWLAIDRNFEDAIASGERLILLITGHQRSAEPPLQRGRIRAAIHDWLAASRHSSHIAAVRGAHPRHGGGGSLYLVLRRRRHPR